MLFNEFECVKKIDINFNSKSQKFHLERGLLIRLELARLLVQHVRVKLEVDVLDALQVDAANLE